MQERGRGGGGAGLSGGVGFRAQACIGGSRTAQGCSRDTGSLFGDSLLQG